MKPTRWERFTLWWRTYWKRLGWSDWVNYLDGWIPRASLFVPIIGYVIIFNDVIVQSLNFAQLAGASDHWGLNGQQRLQLLYYGLVLLGLSNFIFRCAQPDVFQLGRTVNVYVKECLEFYTLDDFEWIHTTIRDEVSIKSNANYDDGEWEEFYELARPGIMTSRLASHFEDAKLKFGGLLRHMLNHTFTQSNSGRRGWLITCIGISTFGYALLIIPSIDLFRKVAYKTITSLFSG